MAGGSSIAATPIFHKDEVHPEHPWCSIGLRVFQRAVAMDDKLRRKNTARLRVLARGVAEGISLFSAHDPDDLDRMRSESRVE